MKVITLNTFEVSGGAARGAYRLHKGLQTVGVQSTMIVKYRNSTDDSVLCVHRLNSLSKWFGYADLMPLIFYPRWKRSPWSVGWLGGNCVQRVAEEKPDLVHLHWICRGLISIRELARIGSTIIWTLHDMWPFTGGCHYSGDCERYMKSCGSCPQLSSKTPHDLSNRIWSRKKHHWSGLNFTIVTPSKWLAGCVRGSSLFSTARVEVIPNGLDTTVFLPVSRTAARTHLNLPVDKKILLMGGVKITTDERKGFDLARSALERLVAGPWGSELELVVFGAANSSMSWPPGLRVTYIGYVDSDRTLAYLYSAADVFLAPSVQENLANTVMEALACGSPCVAFDIGGMPDMIDHMITGYLARPFSSDDLANGIEWVIQDAARHQRLSVDARNKVDREFAIRNVAERYKRLYEDVLAPVSR
jgi:glycosyltransferase involved in cell wall biosynthesis